MPEPTPQEQTLRRIVRVLYGRCLTFGTPTSYARMSAEERESLLAPHADDIKKDVEVLVGILAEERKRGIALAHVKLRKADAFDADAVDEVMASELDAEPNAQPVEVPRRPWPVGM